jgi:ribosomal protein S18 acetylase RimI-like enzyme
VVFQQASPNDSELNAEFGQFRIRRMRPDDLRDFIRLGLPTCAFMHGRPNVSDERMYQNFSNFVREHASSDDSEIYIAEDSHGDYAGQLWLHSTRNRFNGRRELWIWDITVHPKFRRKGLGKQLLAFAKQHAAAHRVEELWLLVSSINYPAIQLYRSTGLRGLGQLMCVPVSGQVSPEKTVEFGATVLRPLASNDVERLQKLWSVAGLPFRPRGRDSLGRLRAFLSTHDDAGWCAAADSHLIGAALVSDDGRRGWIERLAVHPDHRRAGLARAIITACLNSLRERHILVVGALIDKENEASRSLFESCGFVDHPGLCFYSYRENKDS